MVTSIELKHRKGKRIFITAACFSPPLSLRGGGGGGATRRLSMTVLRGKLKTPFMGFLRPSPVRRSARQSSPGPACPRLRDAGARFLALTAYLLVEKGEEHGGNGQ